ncbi:ankycorbin isoform X2 [Conger conger]|uniref:ankycorbin isoform X2 n=1 Tax=Conger conger TaxID=82655 RepID=UPI002A5ABEEA|nr:ankycorbin isoform X2 [Conger conger]
MKSLKAKFRKSDAHEWSKTDERLLSAVEHGEADKVSALLAKKGTSTAKPDSEGRTVLHAAAARGQAECLALILAHGGDASLTDSSGCSALHLSAKHSHQDCAKKLIQSKCAVDLLDGAGRTALHHAAASGSVLIAQLLCEHKSPVNLKDAEGFTPLLLSARHAHADVCRVLIDWGADINTCDKTGRSAVMLASESSSVAAVEVLVQRGAGLQIVDSLGHDVLHYAKLSGSAEIKALLTHALQGLRKDSDTMSPKPLQHDQVGDRSATPKKRKAPPPPISPIQSPPLSEMASPPYLTPSQTPVSSKSTPRKFNYQEDELKSAVLRDEVEKLQEEKSMLLETIEDLKQIVDQTQPKAGDCGNEEPSLVATLHAKIAALSLENQQLAHILKKRQGDSRPHSVVSNASFHSTHDDFDPPSLARPPTQDEDGVFSSVKQDEEQGKGGGGEEEIGLLREALRESQQENLALQALLTPAPGEAELQARALQAEGRYQEAQREVQNLRLELSRGEDAAGQKEALEQEVQVLREQRERDGERIRALEGEVGGAATPQEMEELKTSHAALLESLAQEKAQLASRYQEAQEEVKMLQEALRGTVPVEAAARDFEEMKAELGSVIDGLQQRLVELSHSYSEAKADLSSALSQLQAPPPPELPALRRQAEEAQAQRAAALQQIALLRREAEAQAKSSMPLADHTQVVTSLGSALKEAESRAEEMRERLAEKALQVEALQNRLTVEKDATPDDSVSRLEHQQMRESLEAEVSQLTLLLQDALRKQDDMALEMAAACQEVRDGRSAREALQEQLEAGERHRDQLQETVSGLRARTAALLSSEQDQKKKIEELNKEVSRLKEALNSLSQLSYAPKRPSAAVEPLQQQVKQLQYQLVETKKQHHEIVSVYRMHLLYAVQGQMDEDVQKALKQILMMCKMPTEAK